MDVQRKRAIELGWPLTDFDKPWKTRVTRSQLSERGELQDQVVVYRREEDTARHDEGAGAGDRTPRSQDLCIFIAQDTRFSVCKANTIKDKSRPPRTPCNATSITHAPEP